MLIENCRELADYYEDLLDNITQFSFSLNKDGQFSMESKFRSLSIGNFINKGSSILRNFIDQQKQRHQLESDSDADTIIFPTVQMGLYNINQDCDITSEILQSGTKNSSFYFATGYFNLIERYMRDIIGSSHSNYNILMAHPEANGFLGAKLPAGGIPHAYTLIAKQFRDRILGHGLEERVRMFEYRRPGWTFHGKGLWYSDTDTGHPSLTMIGSPNFGYRSEIRDLESQIVVVTQNKDLQQRLHQEQKHLFDNSEMVTSDTFAQEDRTVPFWVKCVVKFARKWF